MKSSLIKRSLKLTAVIGVGLMMVGAVSAAEVTVPTGGSPLNVNPGSITFDPELTADTGSAQGYTPNSLAISGVLGTDSGYYGNVNLDHGMGEIITGENNDDGAAIDLTNGAPPSGGGGVAPRTGIRASWSGRYLVNLDGDDVVITENGSAGGIEYFVIRVKPVNDVVSEFYYSPADAFQDSNGIDDGTAGAVGDVGDFLTSIDLSDLGYETCTAFEYIEVFEMLTTDRFDSSGYGFVGAGTTPLYRPPVMDQINTIFFGLISQFYDADIGFIWARSAANLVNIPSPNLELTTTDATSGIVFTDACTQVAEGATVGDQFAFRLSAAPSQNVDVTFTVDNPAEILIDNGNVSGLSFVNTFTVTFTPATWNQWVVVNVQGVWDNTDETDPELHAVNISTSSADGAFDGLGASATVYVYDPAINVSTYSPSPVPEGATATYTVVLNAPPGLRNVSETETVSLAITGYNNRLVTPSPTTLQFTRSNWNVPQTVNVLAIDDAVNNGAGYNTSIAHVSSSNVQNPYDSRYGGAGTNLAAVRLRVNITDNDLVDGTPLTQTEIDARLLALWLDIAPTGQQIAEGTSANAFSVRLAGQPLPGEVVVISINSLPGVLAAPVQLVFNEFNWNVYQAVMITPAVDANAQGVYTIPVQVAVTDGTTFTEVIGAVDAVTITVIDGAITNVVPELSAQPFVPAPEVESSNEGTIGE